MGLQCMQTVTAAMVCVVKIGMGYF